MKTFVYLLILTLTVPSAEAAKSYRGCSLRVSINALQAEEIHKLLFELNKYFSLNPRQIRLKNKNDGMKPKIKEILGFEADIATIYNYMLKIKPYPDWLREAGLDPDVIFMSVETISEGSILRALYLLNQNEFSLSAAAAVYGGTNARMAELIYMATGRTLTLFQLYRAATDRREKPWVQWLEEAGVKKENIRSYTKAFNADELLEIAVALRMAGYTLTTATMSGRRDDVRAAKIIELVTGRAGTLAKVYVNIAAISGIMEFRKTADDTILMRARSVRAESETDYQALVDYLESPKPDFTNARFRELNEKYKLIGVK